MQNGVEKYLIAWARIPFPHGIAKCALCPLMETEKRKQCRLTGIYITDDRFTELGCPLLFEEEQTE